MASSSYTAEQSLTGYLYQIRLALLYSLKSLPKSMHDDATFYTGIENYDDISFEDEQGCLKRTIQTKYHSSSLTRLSDYSVDLWRSIRIWINIFNEKKENTPVFYLLTTSEVSGDDATALLTNEVRTQEQEEKILAMLENAANNSTNKDTQDARTMFLNMSPDDRKKLLSRVIICPSSPSGADLDRALEEQLYFACGRRKLPKLREALEGWWLKKIEKLLSERKQARIPSKMLDEEMKNLREYFGAEALQYKDCTPSPEEKNAFKSYRFVRQLLMIDVKKDRTERAVQDYYIASTNRSEWVREFSITDEELEKFDSRLVDTWQRIFYEEKEDCPEDASEEALIKIGREIYKAVGRKDVPELRKVKETSLMMGSYHMLADTLEVGWHPRYRERLQPAEKEGDKP